MILTHTSSFEESHILNNPDFIRMRAFIVLEKRAAFLNVSQTKYLVCELKYSFFICYALSLVPIDLGVELYFQAHLLNTCHSLIADKRSACSKLISKVFGHSS